MPSADCVLLMLHICLLALIAVSGCVNLKLMQKDYDSMCAEYV